LCAKPTEANFKILSTERRQKSGGKQERNESKRIVVANGKRKNEEKRINRYIN